MNSAPIACSAVLCAAFFSSCSGGGQAGGDSDLSPDAATDAGGQDAGAATDAGNGDAGVVDSGPPDRDRDGVPDDADPWPDDRCCATDIDDDLTCDGRDADRDGDDVDDFLETSLGFDDTDPQSRPDLPADIGDRCGAYPDADPDGDGVVNDTDEDDDGDGFLDSDECAQGTGPLDPRGFPGSDLSVPDRCDFSQGNPGPFWLKGDLHVHTTYSDGKEDLASNIRIAEYFADPALVERHPEYGGRGLDFLAITDHRLIDAAFDPLFTSNRLLLIQGEEFGSDGHANALGISTHIPHEATGGLSPTAAIQRGIGITHAQKGVFSVNHPLSEGDYWAWDVRGYDATEVWNSFWGGPMNVVPLEDIAKWEQQHGSVNPVIGLAIAWTQNGLEGARFWEANLTAGRFIAAVGGSDRHMLFMPGYPTTWVRAATNTVVGIIEGIRARHTFVTRSPAAPMIELSAAVDGAAMLAGDVSAYAPSVRADIAVRVTGAPNGRVELVEGVVLDDARVLDIAAVPAPRIAATLDLPADADTTVTWTWAPDRPSWLYARVLERIDLSDYATRTKDLLNDYFRAIERVSAPGSGGAGEIAAGLYPFMDLGATKDECRPDKTPEWRVECIPAVVTGSGTIFIPEHLARPFSVVVRDGKATDFAHGGFTSALALR